MLNLSDIIFLRTAPHTQLKNLGLHDTNLESTEYRSSKVALVPPSKMTLVNEYMWTSLLQLWSCDGHSQPSAQNQAAWKCESEQLEIRPACEHADFPKLRLKWAVFANFSTNRSTRKCFRCSATKAFASFSVSAWIVLHSSNAKTSQKSYLWSMMNGKHKKTGYATKLYPFRYF